MGAICDVDEGGYLENVSNWSPAVAEAMAARDGTELTPAHWAVINFLREY